ncbi:S9 family peptidase [Sphingoaurantiacus capsulatus]|uniref:S9 family peptidase n=1 Tax=Sphingoaurantiacus capsulatus TaxID=1771310 RepID=A0ABV7X666_9SPHN
MSNAPIAPTRPHSFTHHGTTLEDGYAWLKDPGYPQVTDADVLNHLKAENAWFEESMAPLKPLIDTLFEEMKGRLKEDDSSVPQKDGDFLYWWAFEKGGQYRKWWRRPVAGGADQLLLDEPALAEGKDYFRLGSLGVSPDGTRLAYMIDDDGSERFKLRIRDIDAAADIETVTDAAIGQAVWTADGRAVAWTEVNDNWRPFRIRLHRLGETGDDTILYEEADAGFFVGVSRSQDRQWLIVHAADHVTSEVRLIPSSDPTAAPLLVAPRQPGREYEVDVRNGELFIRSNDTHPNFRVVTASVAAPGEWRELIAASDRHYIRGLTSFAQVLAISERIDGLDQIRLRDVAGGEHYIPFPEASYAASLANNPEFDPAALRLTYESMVTPATVYDYHLADHRLEVRKVQTIPSGYDADAYETVRLMAPARDGALVPISVVYKKGFPRDGSGPVHLYGYGAYGLSMPPGFSAARLSLLDRGFAYAIAHIRGGDDLGYRWYLDGKLTKRWNTFNDFVDCAKHLIAEGFAREGGISTSGGSAGGELMGVVANSNPELWSAVVAHVPFVDVLNTMLDDSLPLTPMEWPEWGNPIADAAAFELIRSYSPYDNVEAKPYPPLMVTAGLNDPRVTYWEPAKWVAKLRATKTDANALILKVNMGAGHGGKSGRWDSLVEVAEEFAFVLQQTGRADG